MNELIQMIISQLGVSEDQAKGGAGLLFKLAQEKLGGGDFSKLTDAIGSVDDLIGAAPAEGAVSGLLGGLAGKLGADSLGDLASLVSGFKKLDLDAGMVQQFVPQILEFVKTKGGDEIMDLLQGILK